MLVLKLRIGESIRAEGCGDVVLFTLVELREFTARVSLLHGSALSLFTMEVGDPLVVRLGDVGAECAICVERLFGNSVRISLDAPRVFGFQRIAEAVAA